MQETSSDNIYSQQWTPAWNTHSYSNHLGINLGNSQTIKKMGKQLDSNHILDVVVADLNY